jgi:DNA-binding transcriptional ArsR family regulator
MTGEGRDPAESGRETLDSVDEVFSVLGDETRVEILLELCEVASENGIGKGLGFSALQDRVDVGDSGRFNYHLNRLTGQFVAKRDDTYVARWPALALVAAIHAGLYGETAEMTSESATTEFRCPECHRPLEVRFVEGTLGTGVHNYCPEHGKMDVYSFPPGAQAGRSLLETMRVAYTRLRTNVDLARRGICMECWGRVSTEYPVEAGDPGQDMERYDEFTQVAYQCERCWNQLHVPLRTYIGTHPIVEAAFQERGFAPLRGADALTTEDDITCETAVTESDPTSATVRISFDEETLVVSVDEDCSVSRHHWA